MKRKLLFFAGFVALISMVWVGVLHAANVRTGDAPTVASGETIDGTLYSAGKTVNVAGTVKGDLLCAGQDVTISGTIEGDVLCAAQTVTVTGHVEGNVRSAAQIVTLSGKVDGNVSVAAMTVKISSAASVGHDLSIGGQTVTLDGAVGRDANIAAQTFTITSAVTRNLDVNAAEVSLNGATHVGGDFSYTSTADAKVATATVITGKTQHYTPPAADNAPVSAQAYLAAAFMGFASFLLVGLAVCAASPRLVGAVMQSIKSSPFGALGMGALGMLLPPFIAIVLFITVIGVPLAFVVLFGWFVALLTGLVFTAITIGQQIMLKMQWRDSFDHFGSLTLGLLILFLLSLIPLVGFWAMFLAVLWGIGGLWHVVVKQRRAALAPEKAQGKKS